jgi:hypothetical protein
MEGGFEQNCSVLCSLLKPEYATGVNKRLTEVNKFNAIANHSQVVKDVCNNHAKNEQKG